METKPCKYMLDEICVNDKCPMCCDYCPVPDTEDVCKWEERKSNGSININKT